MPKMYKKGSDSIVVHPSQIENAEARGWTLEKKPSADNKKPTTKPTNKE
tara:strand:- start:334 stop:480 length:147 start_codon:yes stop_codon:yes gene_type:complete